MRAAQNLGQLSLAEQQNISTVLDIVRNPEADVASQCIILQKQISNPNFSLRRFIINLGSYITNSIRQN